MINVLRLLFTGFSAFSFGPKKISHKDVQLLHIDYPWFKSGNSNGIAGHLCDSCTFLKLSVLIAWIFKNPERKDYCRFIDL